MNVIRKVASININAFKVDVEKSKQMQSIGILVLETKNKLPQCYVNKFKHVFIP